jgi:FdhE protein
VSAPGVEAPTFEGLARAHPEWQGWLAVMRLALDAAATPEWSRIAVRSAPERPVGAPWLAGAAISVPDGLARRWVTTLLRASAPAGAARRPALDPAAFLRAAIELDADGLAAAGRAAALDADAVRALAHPAALPALAACAGHAGAITAGWDRPYCPVCGAWPALAELRGLELSRQLRCGRCGADWAAPWLACVYCGNDDHEELDGLVSESGGTMRRVDTCRRCHGYLKSVTTLTARSHAEVLLEDLATVAYDVGALDAGASRPPGLGWAPGVTLALTRRSGLGRLWS